MAARTIHSIVASLAVTMITVVPVSADAGKVSGKLAMPAEGYGPAPARTRGFVERRANPYLPVKSFTPYPYVAIVLEGASEEPEPERTEVFYEIVGQTFDSPLLVVQTGRPIKIKNSSLEQQRLFSPEGPSLLDKADVINKDGARPLTIKKEDAGKVFHIRSTTNPRMIGRVVAFSHPYFSTVDRTGRFEIKDVPKGKYTVRVWYKDGWLPTKSTVEVGRGTARVNDLKLPKNLEPKKTAKAKAKAKAPKKGADSSAEDAKK